MRYIQIAKRANWSIFIVGDQKTPHEPYLKLAQAYPFVSYITPQKQDSKYHELSNLIGWNCIQRRNIGFIEAYNWGAEIIATVDDDNIPYANWGQLLAVGDEPLVAVHDRIEPVFDPLSATRYKDLWHRGFPIEMLNGRHRGNYIGHQKRPTCLVQADLWDGEPDVDAIARIALGPFDCHFDSEPFASTRPGPFNSQNTFLHRSVFPTYFLFPNIGRMDDIWASYVLQKYFPASVVYGSASVYQERNVHNLAKDLKLEQMGYEKTGQLIKQLYSSTSDNPDAWLAVLPDGSKEVYAEYAKQFKVDLSTGNPQNEKN